MTRKTAGKILLTSAMFLLAVFTIYRLTQAVQAQGAPPRPTPTPTAPLRPTPTQTPPFRYTPTPTPFPRGTPTPTAPHHSKAAAKESAPPETCPVLQGHLLSVSNSFQPAPRAQLAGNGWALKEGLNTSNAFRFACLGEGIATLNPVLAEGYQALTQDVALRTAHRLVMEVNLGYYRKTETPLPAPPLTLRASSPDQNTAILSFTAKNTANHPLLNAWMTLLLPAGLAVDNVQANGAAVEVWQNLITLDFAPIPPGQTITAQIAVHPAAETTAQTWNPVASFGCSDGITRQTPPLELSFPQISPPVFLPVTGGDGS